MLKKTSLFVVIACALFACTDDKSKEKAALDEVIKIHDEVMGKEEYLMRNKMQMDSILTPGPVNDKYSMEQKVTISAMRFKLVAADEAMSIWMQRFDPELKGKTHEQKLKYYAEQKKAVTRLDSQITVAVEASDKYLKEIKK
ncbi:hypothetical protein [Mucilaginibacter auburnensis]|nr:hypothetical protein [Mucilaginibacter auburnensis]